jgi:phosphomannomutase
MIGEQVVAAGAHFGVSIEDDGEVCRLLDEQGRPVPAESLLLLLVRHRLTENPHAAIILEDNASPTVAREIESLGGRVLSSRPARADMAAAMCQHGAIFGGGPSGRFWTPAGNIPLPDALKTLTLLLVLLSRDDRRLSEVLSNRDLGI